MGKIYSICCSTQQNIESLPTRRHQLQKVILVGENSSRTHTDPLLTNENQQQLEVLEVCESISAARIVVPSETSPSPTSPQLQHQNYFNYPLLLDKDTIEYVKKSKVLVILKGLPGSGKSHIAQRASQVYQDIVICSADDYFLQDGVYIFDKDKLKNAHEACKEKALEAAQRGRHMILIDNTNVKAWESKHYLQLARQHQYVPLILEPQTPWAMDPDELAKRNSHRVSKEVLERKVKDYEPVLPLYYWWFLNEVDSNAVMRQAQEWLRKALQIHQFFQDFSNFTKLSALNDMMSYFVKSRQSGGYGLHATACVTRRGKEENAMEYINSDVVRGSLVVHTQS